MEPEVEQAVAHTEEQPASPSADEIADWQKKAAVSSQNFERAKRAELEAKELRAQLEALQGQSVTFEDTDILAKVAALEAQINQDKEQKLLDEVYKEFSVIGDKKAEFEEFRKEYPSANIKSIAKLFLVENDLIEAPKRKQLEKPGGGQRVVHDSGKMTADDVKKLRMDSPKKYFKMLKEGKIQIAD